MPAAIASSSSLVGVYDHDHWSPEPSRPTITSPILSTLTCILCCHGCIRLAEALEQALPPRDDRDPAARLFPASGADALRRTIGKACKALAIPVFSQHDLRHRRISLLHLRGVPWARIGEFVGQRDLTVTANTYTHVLVDAAEVDYAGLLET